MSGEFEMNEAAELLSTQIFWRIFNKSQDVETIRRLANHGFSQMAVKAKIEAQQIAHFVANSPEFDEIFTNKEAFFKISGGVDKFANMQAERNINTYQVAIDAASLILTHSYLDATAFDYCRVIEMVSPQSWEKFVSDRKFTVKELKGKTYGDVLHQHVNRFVKSLERASLIEKTDRIFEICPPPLGYVFIQGYEFNRDRLIKLDELRHDIVHGDGLKQPISACEDELLFLQRTAMFLFGILSKKFNVRISPTLWVEDLKRSAGQNPNPPIAPTVS